MFVKIAIRKPRWFLRGELFSDVPGQSQNEANDADASSDFVVGLIAT